MVSTLNVENRTMVPPLASITTITFSMRAKRCYGSRLPVSGFGRVATYFGT